jgi:hypothetical protein
VSSNLDLESRLRSHLTAERQAYGPPALLAPRIRQAIRGASLPARRQALMPQLAAAAGLIALVALLSVGFAWIKSAGGGPATTYRIATVRSDAYHLARFDGVLHGQANPDGTACLWVGEGERMALIWPSGYVARGNPLAVYDQHGTLIGVVGKPVILGGSGGWPDDGRPVSVLGCSGFFSTWYASPESRPNF